MSLENFRAIIRSIIDYLIFGIDKNIGSYFRLTTFVENETGHHRD